MSELETGKLQRILDNGFSNDRISEKTAPQSKLNFYRFRDQFISSMVMAGRSLWLHKMRTFLSILGIIIGTAAVVSLMAFGEGSMQDALEDIKRQGATNIIIRSVKPPDKSSDTRRSFFFPYGLTAEDYIHLKTIPTVITSVGMRIFPQEVRRSGRMVLARVVATYQDYEKVNRFEMADGRFIRDAEDMGSKGDDRQLRNVAVLGSALAERLFPFEKPLGQTVNMNKQRYIVVGVMEERAAIGSTAGGKRAEEFNKDIYIPYETCRARFGKKTFLRQSGSRSGEIVEYHQITLTVENMDDVHPTAKVVEKILLERHSKQDWEIIIPRDRLDAAKRTRDRYTLMLGAIACISLVVGGIGIMNIMLATVTERTREIGIRRALGAKRRDITLQFVVEAMLQTSMGGIFGVILGLGIIFGFPFVWELITSNVVPTKIHYGSFVWALGLAVGVGVSFGLYPAWRAAKLDPIEALRHT